MFIPSSVPSAYRSGLQLADTNPRQAVLHAKHGLLQTNSTEPLAQAWAFYSVGWTLFRWERLSEAATYFEQALACFRSIEDAAGLLHCRVGQVFIGWMSGTGRSLQQEWQSLVDAYQLRGDEQAVAQLQIYQAAHLNMLGDTARSIAQLTTLVSNTSHNLAPSSLARLQRILGAAYLNQADFPTAERYYRGALQTFRRLNWQSEIAKCLFEQARLAEQRGKYRQAISLLQKALDLAAQHELVLLKSQCEKGLGLIYSRLGYYQQAIELLVTARSLFIANQRPDQAAQCDHNLGIIFYYYGLFDFSQAFYRRAQNSYQALDKTHDLLIVQRNQALIVRRQGQPEAALQLLQHLAEAAQQTNDLGELAAIFQAQAQCWNDQGRHEQALDALQQAYAYFTAIQHADAMGECLLEYATTALLLNKYGQARDYFQRAKRLLQKRPMYMWLAVYGLGRCAHAQGQLKKARMYYQKAQAIVLNMRRSVPSEHASSGFFSQAQALYGDSLSVTMTLGDAAAVLEVVEQQRAVTLQHYLNQPAAHMPLTLRHLYQQRRETLQHLINAAAPEHNINEALQEYLLLSLELRHIGFVPATPIADRFELDRIRQQFDLAYGTAWICLIYSFYGEHLLIFSLTTTSLAMTQQRITPQARHLLNQLTKPEYREFTYDDYAYAHGRSAERWSILRQAQALLLPSDIEQLSDPDHHLLLLPDECLHDLPWAALAYRSQRLCQHAVLHQIPALQRIPSIERAGQSPNLLFIGCSFRDSDAPLTYVLDELEQVQQHWQYPIEILLDESASRQRIVQPTPQTTLGNYSHIHIATHGQMTSQQGLRAYIKLHDGAIFYDEILQLQIADALVILSVCHGADGDVLPGAEVLSLSRAFLGAGAAAVICHLWWVDDEYAVAMMDRLYQQLRLGYAAPTALAYAQRQWIEQQRDLTTEQSSAIWSGWSVIER
ncbi:CHAT domain-containing protein [Herpetosiphon sp. NSE202]|uniref:CHAT domain-containing protein n=1 Tax=Herpetosiphon sp. NSE202 TaxID=3351349 RepID=UPI00362EAA7C